MRWLRFVLAGCALHNAEPLEEQTIESSRRAVEFPVPLQHPVDVLFVIDRSRAMLEQHARVVASMTVFATALEAYPHGQDMHIGVVASDGGLLVGNRFLTDISLIDSFATDFSGPLADQLTALGDVGTDGSVNPPLETIVRAVDPSTNPGFRRDGADLVAQIITDQDDQSQRAVDDPTLRLDQLRARRCIHSIRRTARVRAASRPTSFRRAMSRRSNKPRWLFQPDPNDVRQSDVQRAAFALSRPRNSDPRTMCDRNPNQLAYFDLPTFDRICQLSWRPIALRNRVSI
jgi:hypothetical protein